MTNTARATRIVELADAMEINAAILTEIMYQVMDAGNDDATELHRAIRAAFSGDDDFDDLMHEIDHVYGDCADGDDDCAWNED